MPAVPPIRRAPFDPNEVFRTDRPIPVIASLRWSTEKGWAEPRDTDALVLAWTPSAVEIEWTHDDQTFTDWIHADDIRRQ